MEMKEDCVMRQKEYQSTIAAMKEEHQTMLLSTSQALQQTSQKEQSLLADNLKKELLMKHKSDILNVEKEHQEKTKQEKAVIELGRKKLFEMTEQLAVSHAAWQEVEQGNTEITRAFKKERERFEQEQQENLEYAGRLEEELELAQQLVVEREKERNVLYQENEELKSTHEDLKGVHEEILDQHANVVNMAEVREEAMVLTLSTTHDKTLHSVKTIHNTELEKMCAKHETRHEELMFNMKEMSQKISAVMIENEILTSKHAKSVVLMREQFIQEKTSMMRRAKQEKENDILDNKREYQINIERINLMHQAEIHRIQTVNQTVKNMHLVDRETKLATHQHMEELQKGNSKESENMLMERMKIIEIEREDERKKLEENLFKARNLHRKEMDKLKDDVLVFKTAARKEMEKVRHDSMISKDEIHAKYTSDAEERRAGHERITEMERQENNRLKKELQKSKDTMAPLEILKWRKRDNLRLCQKIEMLEQSLKLEIAVSSNMRKELMTHQEMRTISAGEPPRKDAGGVVDDDGSGWYDHDPKTSNPIDDLFYKMNVLSSESVSLDTPGETMSLVTLVMSEQEETLSAAALPTTTALPTTPPLSSQYAPPITTPSSFRTPPLLPQSARSSIFSVQDPLESPARAAQLPWNTPSRRTVNTAQPRTPAPRRDWGRRDGVHWWVGCGRMKSKIERMATHVTKLRGIAMQRALDVPPHPEIWIAAKKPSQAALDSNPNTRVSDEDAQRDGCSYCRWEAEQYIVIGQMCQDVLKNDSIKQNDDDSEWY